MDHQAHSPRPADTPRTLAIFGATGATGDAAVTYALARGHRVRAIDIGSPRTPRQGANYYTANVLSDTLDQFVEGTDAVLSCLGVDNHPQTLLSPPPLYTDGTAAICDAMEHTGVKRLIVMSASFVEARNRGPIWFKLPAMVALHRVFDQMGQMEEQLQHRKSIDWTAVRPGWLMAGERSDDYTVQADVIPEDMIRTRRADVGAFMVDLAESGEWVRRTPALARHEAAEKSNPEAVVRDMLG